MRMQIFLPDELAEHLKNLAWYENRYPKQQAEWLLHKAISQAVQDMLPTHPEAPYASQE